MVSWNVIIFLAIQSSVLHQNAAANEEYDDFDLSACPTPSYHEEIILKVCSRFVMVEINANEHLLVDHLCSNYDQINDFNHVFLQNFLKPGSKVTILIHGFNSDKDNDKLEQIGKVLINHKDESVRIGSFVLIQWHKLSHKSWGSQKFGYYEAKHHTISVGNALACFLKTLTSKYSIDADKIHLIGHSLGAHIAGHAAYLYNEQNNNRTKIGRISALDPANEMYDEESKYRVDRPDAKFVDVILTNRGKSFYHGSFGNPYLLGHVTFLPNGGHHQPMCSYMSDISDSCSHSIAKDYYLQSITLRDKCQFYAFPFSATNLDDIKSYAFDRSKDINDLSTMGHFASHTSCQHETFYLETKTISTEDSGYCVDVNIHDVGHEILKVKESVKKLTTSFIWLRYQTIIIPSIFFSLHLLAGTLYCRINSKFSLKDCRVCSSSVFEPKPDNCWRHSSVVFIWALLYLSLLYFAYILLPSGYSVVLFVMLSLMFIQPLLACCIIKNVPATKYIVKCFINYNIMAMSLCFIWIVIVFETHL